MQKIMLTRASYGGLPYPEGSVVEVQDHEATFAIQSGYAINAQHDAEVTPIPTEIGTFKADSQREAAFRKERRKEEEERQKNLDRLSREGVTIPNDPNKPPTDNRGPYPSPVLSDDKNTGPYAMRTDKDGTIRRGPLPATHWDEDKTAEEPNKTLAQGGTDYASAPAPHPAINPPHDTNLDLEEQRRGDRGTNVKDREAEEDYIKQGGGPNKPVATPQEQKLQEDAQKQKLAQQGGANTIIPTKPGAITKDALGSKDHKK